MNSQTEQHCASTICHRLFCVNERCFLSVCTCLHIKLQTNLSRSKCWAYSLHLSSAACHKTCNVYVLNVNIKYEPLSYANDKHIDFSTSLCTTNQQKQLGCWSYLSRRKDLRLHPGEKFDSRCIPHCSSVFNK